MSLLSSFISTQLLKAIEHEFVNHEPEMQTVILNEVQAFVADAAAWINSKLDSASGDKS